MFVLAGSTPEAADAAAKSVFELEKRFAEATLDNVARRDPNQRDHKTRFDGLAIDDSRIRLGRLLRRGRAASHRPQRDRAEVPAGIQSRAEQAPIGSGATIWTWLRCSIPSPTSSLSSFRRAGFCLPWKVPQRRDRAEAALEAAWRRGDPTPSSAKHSAEPTWRSTSRRQPRRSMEEMVRRHPARDARHASGDSTKTSPETRR